ncbi:UNVERIFIED_CONTAM: hypothetical protein NCL1_41933 [Trichonephila clavipes]
MTTLICDTALCKWGKRKKIVYIHKLFVCVLGSITISMKTTLKIDFCSSKCIIFCGSNINSLIAILYKIIEMIENIVVLKLIFR